MVTKERRRKRRVVERWVYNRANDKVLYIVPKSLIEENILEDLPSDLDKQKAEAILYYVVGTIIHKNRKNWYSSQKFEAIPLRHEFLAKVLGRRFKDYLDFFISKNILFRRAYDPGITPYAYSLNNEYQRNFIWKEITYEKIVEAIKRRRQELFLEQQERQKNLADTLYWFTTGNLEIDAEKAKKYLTTLKNRRFLRLIANTCSDESLIDLITYKLPGQLRQGEKSVEDLAMGEFHISIDPKRHRLYSSITSMMSPLRNFLTYDKKRLIAIDIKNSQPFHFCFVLSNDFWSPQNRKCSFISLCPTLYETLKEEKTSFSEIRKIAREQPKDIQEYIKLTQQGGFYEYMCDFLGNDYVGFKDRAGSKLRFLQFLNFDISKQEASAYGDYRQFKNTFPNVCQVMEFLKRRHYTDIGTVLQKLEAKMVLQYFVKAFADKLPDVPIFTVHDSIITLEDYKDQAAEILNETYDGVFGFHPLTDGGKLLIPENAYNTLESYIDDKAVPELELREEEKPNYENLKNMFQEFAA